LILLALLVAGHAAAQYSPAASEVLALAPRLEAFAGSAANYRSLMRGLTHGSPVTLADPVDARFRARFTPQCVLSEAEARQVLIAAAERLAAQHVGDPAVDELRAAVVRVLEVNCSAAAGS
jgi:hypothetical protein